jgi:hypothetical protein
MLWVRWKFPTRSNREYFSRNRESATKEQASQTASQAEFEKRYGSRTLEVAGDQSGPQVTGQNL